MEITEEIIAEFLSSIAWAADATKRAYAGAIRVFSRLQIPLDTNALSAFDSAMATQRRAFTTRHLYTSALGRFLLWLEGHDRLPGFSWARAKERLKNGRGRERFVYQPNIPDPDIPHLVTYWDNTLLPAAPTSRGATPIQRLAILRNRALLHTFLSTASRLSEVMSLTRRSVYDGKAGEVMIQGKGGYSRTIFFSPKCQQSIAEYCVERVDHCPALWITCHTWLVATPLSGNGAYDLVKHTAARVGLPGRITPHSFRHWVATDMLERGMPLEIVQMVLGHHDISMTRKVYAHTRIGTLRRYVNGYHQTNGGIGPQQMPTILVGE